MTYSVSLGGFAMDSDGLELGKDVSWSFTAGPSDITDHGEFPWWIIALVIAGMVGIGVYLVARKKPYKPQKTEEPAPEAEETDIEEEADAEVAAGDGDVGRDEDT